MRIMTRIACCVGALAAAAVALGAHGATHTGDDVWTEPYALTTCPISGKKLGSMGDAVVKKYDGREVRFCCGGCPGSFEKDLDASWAKVDKAIAKDQMRFYPVKTCVLSGESLFEGEKDQAKTVVVGNRLVRVCCDRCAAKVAKSPEEIVAELNKLTIEAQRADYPVETCVVGGEKLASVDEPVETVIAGRLVRLCCEKCEAKVKENPTKYLATIDKAWQAKGKYMPPKEEKN